MQEEIEILKQLKEETTEEFKDIIASDSRE